MLVGRVPSRGAVLAFPSECEISGLALHTLSSPPNDSAGVQDARVQDAGGIPAISRWLSETRATPPVTRFHIPCTLARVPATSPHAGTPCRGAIHITLQSGGVASLDHRLQARVPPGKKLGLALLVFTRSKSWRHWTFLSAPRARSASSRTSPRSEKSKMRVCG